MVSAGPETKRVFACTHALTEMTSGEQAKTRPAYWLERLAQRMAQGVEVRSPKDGLNPDTAGGAARTRLLRHD